MRRLFPLFANEHRTAVHDRAVDADFAHGQRIAREDVVGEEHQVGGITRKKSTLHVFFEARKGASRRVAVDRLFDRELFLGIETVRPAFGVKFSIVLKA